MHTQLVSGRRRKSGTRDDVVGWLDVEVGEYSYRQDETFPQEFPSGVSAELAGGGFERVVIRRVVGSSCHHAPNVGVRLSPYSACRRAKMSNSSMGSSIDSP